jgi:uncharacterized membrane protein YphA (DoxX/SURF4 family)
VKLRSRIGAIFPSPITFQSFLIQSFLIQSFLIQSFLIQSFYHFQNFYLMSKYINWAATAFLALPFIVFGLNKFIGFASPPPPTDPVAQAFLGAMFTSFLAPLTGAIEIVGGLLVFVRRTAFLGWLLLAPIVVSISAFHIMHDMPGNGIWLISLLCFAVVGYGHKDRIADLITA